MVRAEISNEQRAVLSLWLDKANEKHSCWWLVREELQLNSVGTVRPRCPA